MTIPPTSPTNTNGCQRRAADTNLRFGFSDSLIDALMTHGGAGFGTPSPPSSPLMNPIATATATSQRTNHQSLIQIIDEALNIMEEDDEEILRLLARDMPVSN